MKYYEVDNTSIEECTATQDKSNGWNDYTIVYPPSKKHPNGHTSYYVDENIFKRYCFRRKKDAKKQLIISLNSRISYFQKQIEELHGVIKSL